MSTKKQSSSKLNNIGTESSLPFKMLDRFDYIVMPTTIFIAAIWALFYIGSSIEWDDLLYMNISQYTTKQAWVLNRYGHIYLQKVFMFVFNDTITGAKVYWCFLYAGSSILIYWCVRLLADYKNHINAILATVFFWSQPLFFKYAGCTFADMTVMFLLTLGSFVFLAFLTDNPKNRKIILIIIGAIFFWAIKSKETGICLGMLFLALGRNKNGQFQSNRFWQDFKWATIGIISALFVLMFLDLCFLRDFFFSIRPSSIKTLMSFNTGEYQHDYKNTSWYTNLSIGPICAAFLLYILAGFKISQNSLQRQKLYIWLIPLSVIFFITAIAIQIRADSTIRYIMPAIAGICTWASMCFYIPIEGKININKNLQLPRITVIITISFLTFLIAKLFTDNAINMVSNAGWTSIDSLYKSTILPLATTGLIICIILSKKHGIVAQAITLLCFFFIIYHPLANNITSLKNETIKKQSQWRYEPYRIFGDKLTFDENIKIFISDDIYKTRKMLGRNVKSHCWLFNVFFNQNFNYDQFITGSAKELQKINFNYAFISFNDAKLIDKSVLQKYNIIPDSKIGVAFIKNNSR